MLTRFIFVLNIWWYPVMYVVFTTYTSAWSYQCRLDTIFFAQFPTRMGPIILVRIFLAAFHSWPGSHLCSMQTYCNNEYLETWFVYLFSTNILFIWNRYWLTSCATISSTNSCKLLASNVVVAHETFTIAFSTKKIPLELFLSTIWLLSSTVFFCHTEQLLIIIYS